MRFGKAIAAMTAGVMMAGLSACGERAPRSGDAAEAEEEARFDRILSAQALGKTAYILAEIGVRDIGRGFSSRGSSRSVYDLWLIERESGAATSLLKPGSGLVTEAAFFPAQPGKVPTRMSVLDVAEIGSEDKVGPDPDYYLIETERKESGTALFVGKLSDRRTLKIAEGLDSIVYKAMLDERRLAIVAIRDGGQDLMILDMDRLKIEATRSIAVAERQD